MKLTKHIGCLLALVFATASALAADWFTGTLGETLGAGVNGAWVAASAISGWTWDAGNAVGTYKNFDVPLTFQADESRGLSTNDSTIVTMVKFTAMDAADFTGEVPTDAKAGLTVIEDENGVLSYKGLVGGQNGTKEWATLSGQPRTDIMVTVKVQLFKDINDATFVRYIVDEDALKYNDVSDIAIDSGTAIQFVEYKGMCDIKSLSALAWGNGENDKEAITFSEQGMPATINVNRVELRARGVDVDNVDAIKTYLSAKQANGLRGWVNSALAIGDSENVSNLVSNVSAENAVKVNFGFEKDEESTLLGYTVDGKTTTAPSIALTSENNTGIHTVEVSVTKGGVTEKVATIDVGVMETGKQLTPEQKAAIGDKKTYDIIAAPWDGYGDQNPTVDSLLNTAELTAGDKLYVKKTSGGYDEYTLETKGGTWTKAAAENALQSRSNQGAGDEDEGLEPGSAVWIEHSVNSRLILAGEAGDPSAEPQFDAVANDWTLMANPSIKPLAISSIQGNVGDQIVIEDVADPRQYEKKTEGWGWYEPKTTTIELPGGITVPSTRLEWTAVTAADVIGAGIGFWYVNTGANAVTITFPNNQSE